MRSYVLIAVLALLTACHKEAALKPTAIPPLYTLPQGTQPYDDSILAFHQHYGSYILYKFNQTDFAYNYTNVRTDTAFVADTAYIPQALQFLEQQLFRFYPDSFLQRTMPLKILLASGITPSFTTYQTGFATTSSMMAFGYVNSSLPTLSTDAVKKVRSWAHQAYMERACRVNADSIIPPGFTASAPVYGSSTLTESNKYQYGIVAQNYTDVMAVNLVADFLGYIEMITGHSYAELTAAGGPLSPGVDVNGLVMKRYNIIIAYYMQFGIDLQAIGNAP